MKTFARPRHTDGNIVSQEPARLERSDEICSMIEPSPSISLATY